MSERDEFDLDGYQSPRGFRHYLEEAERHPDWVYDPDELVADAAYCLQLAKRVAAMTRAQEAVL